MRKLTAAFVAAGLIAVHGTAFALSESKRPSAPLPDPPKASAPLNTSLGFDAAYALTAPPSGVGFAVVKQGAARGGGGFGFAVSKPMANDPAPLAGLSPGGSETDFSIIFAAPLAPQTTGVVSLAARREVDNLPGQRDVAAMVRVKHSF